MYFREGNTDREAESELGPMSTRSSLLDTVHKALFYRAEMLEKEHPGMRVEHDFEDNEPRAVLWLLDKDGQIVQKEFIESVFSAGKPERDVEYIDAARRYGRLAIHYPGLIMQNETVIRMLSDLWINIKDTEVQERASIQGYLYSSDGRMMQPI